MSTYIDARANTTNANSFLYQNLAPTSSTSNNNSSAAHQQSQTQPQTNLDVSSSLLISTKNDNYTNNDHLIVDYLVSPKPSSSRISSSPLTDDTSDSMRRSSIQTLKSINLENANHLKKKCTLTPSLATLEKPKVSTNSKADNLQHAKNQYEQLTGNYFKQLTTGCQQKNCKNKFCASSKNGIIGLQPQAALVMSMQLASMSDTRLCFHPKQTSPIYPEPHPTKPFLQSFFRSKTFSSLFHLDPTEPEPKINQPIVHHWTTDFWKILTYFNTHETYDEEDEPDLDLEPIITLNLETGLDYLQRLSDDQIDPWCHSVFEHWEGIGYSFKDQGTFCHQLEDLKKFYQAVLDQKLQQMITSISDSFELLLDRLLLNVGSVEGPQDMLVAWARSIMFVFFWIILCKMSQQSEERDGLAAIMITKYENLTNQQKKMAYVAYTSQAVLTQKVIHVVCKIAQNKKSILYEILSNMFISLGPQSLEMIVLYLQQYLLEHFHTGPYIRGFEDIVVMTLKNLEFLYQSSMKNPNAPIIPATIFYSKDLCKKLNIKSEYRIWKSVLKYGEGRHGMKDMTEYQRKSRLFMTTYPFVENQFQFSWINYPFLLPPELKRKIVLMEAMSQMSTEYEDACVNHTLVVYAQKILAKEPTMLKRLKANLKSATCPYLLLEIRRDRLIDDTLVQLSKKWADLRKPLKVKFVGGGEAGVDQGGVQKEFFGVLFEKVVSTEVGLFLQDDQTRLCWIRPVDHFDRRMYEMVGVLMGLAIYNGVLMSLQLPKVLWKVLVVPNEAMIEELAAKKQLFTLDDLEDGWPTLSNGLKQLLEYKEDDVEDVFCRDYEISMDIFGKGIVTIPLMEEPVVPVTNDNREKYVQDYCTYFMYTAQKEQLLAIRRGVWSVIGSRALNLCTADELEMVACGLKQGPNAIQLNMIELEEVTEYDDGYNADHPTIKQFWSVIHQDLTNEQKKKLLLFVTASDRIPVGGLKELNFYIQRNGPDNDRLPTALTCFSRLLLPEYTNREKLRDRLITAIENTKGFGLV